MMILSLKKKKKSTNKHCTITFNIYLGLDRFCFAYILIFLCFNFDLRYFNIVNLKVTAVH